MLPEIEQKSIRLAVPSPSKSRASIGTDKVQNNVLNNENKNWPHLRALKWVNQLVPPCLQRHSPARRQAKRMNTIADILGSSRYWATKDALQYHVWRGWQFLNEQASKMCVPVRNDYAGFSTGAKGVLHIQGHAPTRSKVRVQLFTFSFKHDLQQNCEIDWKVHWICAGNRTKHSAPHVHELLTLPHQWHSNYSLLIKMIFCDEVGM